MATTTLELPARLLVHPMNAVSPIGCDPLKGVRVLVNTPMFWPGKLALVLMACLFVSNCDDSNVYWRGLTSVVGWAKLGLANDPRRRRGRMYLFMDGLRFDWTRAIG
jgi:hypothetical protein